MKSKRFLSVLLIAVFCLTLAFAACKQHEHVWKIHSNDELHWEVCEDDGVEKNGSRQAHFDSDSDGRCDVCNYSMSTGPTDGSDETDHTHDYATLRDATNHWTRCLKCGEETAKTAHVQQANYLCSCGYAFDAPAANGQVTTDYWIIGSFTDNRSDGQGWGQYHNEQWKFHRLTDNDSQGKTQFVFERQFKKGDEFKVVNSAGSGYWDGELNAGHRSESSKKYLGGNGGGNIQFVGSDGYYRLTLHVSGGNATIDCDLVYSDTVVVPHEHSYSNVYSYNEEEHWYAATCQHTDLKKGAEAHDFGSGVICSKCGYKQAHVCQAESEWSKNKTEHWKKCRLCGEPIESTVAAHNGVPCNECGYELAISGALKFELNADQTGYNVIGYDPDLIEEDVNIPASYNSKPVVAITNKAFTNCLTIQSVIIPDSVTLIDIYSFANCSNLEAVTLGKNVKTIAMGAFQYTKITKIALPSGLITIGNSAFEYSHLTTVTIPASVTQIGSFAFRNYMGSATTQPQLNSVTFENTSGWKVYPLSYELDPTVPGIDIDVTNAIQNAHNLIIVNNPIANPEFDGYAQYIWIRG